jgi:membrane-associated protease RseP (regulator of RpoE activity)
MNTRTSERRSHFAIAAIVCLAFSVPLLADEGPANNQGSKPTNVNGPATIALDLAYPQLALSEIHLAANSDLIGADVAQVDNVLRSHLGLGEGKGLVVAAVGDDTPAAKAGIQKNDVLIAIGNEEIAGLEGFRRSLEASADKPITLVLIRAGKKQSIEVTPHSGSVTAQLLCTIAQQPGEPKYWLGIGLAGADDTLRSQLSLVAGEGLVVTNVESDSPAAKAGVLVNDLLLKLDGKSLTTIEALTEQLQTIGDKPVALELLRRGKPATLTVAPEKHAEAVANGLAWLAGNTYAVDLASNNQYFVSVQYPQLAVDFIQAQSARPELAKQLADLDMQVKQLEAAIAALRSTIEASAQPAQSSSAEAGPEKK